jgi:biopolymer transport protein ExbD
MASGASKRRIQKSAGMQDLNLIPMMNLFIIIIPLLLTITVTVHMAFLSLDLSASGTGGSGEGESSGQAESRSKEIRLILYSDRFEIREEGVTDPIIIPARVSEDGTVVYNYAMLDNILAEIKTRNTEISEIRITPYPDVLYGTLIRAIDMSKIRGFPDVKYERIRVGEL